MSCVDYGTLIFKNGKQINFEQFMPIAAIGVKAKTAIDESGRDIKLDGNCFGFAGDEEFYIATYKIIVCFVYNGVINKYFF